MSVNRTVVSTRSTTTGRRSPVSSGNASATISSRCGITGKAAAGELDQCGAGDVLRG